MTDSKSDMKFPILTQEEIKALLEEGRKGAEIRRNPPPPGDYKLSHDRRGKLTEHICGVCKSQVEKIFRLTWPEHGNKGTWSVEKYRCQACKLVYDYD